MMQTKIPDMQELLSAGVHFGHQVRRGNPKMKPFIYGEREGVHVIDLAQSEEKLIEAAKAAYELGKAGQVMLIVGTKKQAKGIVENLAKQVGTPYLTERWIGGLLTNFDEVRRNIKKLVDLKDQQVKGELTRYTKKEQLLISRKLAKFDKELGGISDVVVIPEAIFIIDAVANDVALREARKVGLIILGLCDTNADPNSFDFPVPANDDGIKSIKMVAETVIGAYGEGKKAAADKVAKDLEDQEEAKVTAEKAAEEVLDTPVAEEAAAIEEEIEKKILDESERKIE